MRILILTFILGITLYSSIKGQNNTDTIEKCNLQTVLDLKINKENISDQLIMNFLFSLDESCTNNVEFSEASNWMLFWLAENRTEKFITILIRNKNTLEMDWIINQFSEPIHDGIDLEAIDKKLRSLDLNDKCVLQILDSIKIAANKLGNELD